MSAGAQPQRDARRLWKHIPAFVLEAGRGLRATEPARRGREARKHRRGDLAMRLETIGTGELGFTRCRHTFDATSMYRAAL
jgi:hypothetical protein